MREERISSDALLFDPNNYRFQDLDEFVYAADDRFHEDAVQQRAYRRLLKEDGISGLKNSISRNGYMPVERLIVRPYEHADGYWVVIEGNRRLAASKWLLDEHSAGATLPEPTLETVRTLPVIVVEEEERDEVFRASLMGVRHVSGVREWGGYQRAKLVTQMRDGLSLDAGEVADRLGMSVQEVNRRYRAFKALQQMQNDDEFGAEARPVMYPLFHEAVSVPLVRDWLGWDEETNEFTKTDDLELFYRLLSSTDDPETEKKREAKITTYSQVRQLRHILQDEEAKRLLFDLERPFEEAVAKAKQEELAQMWRNEVSTALNALQSIEIKELKSLDDDSVDLLRRLSQEVTERLEDIGKLRG